MEHVSFGSQITTPGIFTRHGPFATLLASQYRRDDTKTRKSFLNTLYTRIFVGATVRQVMNVRTRCKTKDTEKRTGGACSFYDMRVQCLP